jgi:hypothetical protein
MKRNVYRQGIPKGANGQTADKVGFLDAFLHDAATLKEWLRRLEADEGLAGTNTPPFAGPAR